ncbi:ABC transporter permease [Polycladidibacter stylochi]|uniref:ABC transporter permease n=1 Tax=Polycladidibacter stylochi TaxID=1807766 RepID=UPI00083060FC|nr:ABC transporter permease [Pseudovibrio stylochi]
MKLSTNELLKLQVRVILSLVLRETRATFGGSSIGYLWAIITPTAGVALLVFIFSLAGRHAPYGASLTLFFGTGMFTLQLYNELSGKLMNVLNANKALLTYPLIKDLDTIIARALLIIITYILIVFIFYYSLYLVGLADAPAHPEHVILAFFATAFFGTSVGIVNAVILSVWETWSQIEKVITKPLMFVSGVFYVPSHLPPQAVNILKWNPILQLVEWTRTGFYDNYNSLIMNIYYPIFVSMLLMLLGLAGERFLRKKRV